VPKPSASERRLRRNLAHNVRRLRRERGLTLEATADLAGINIRHVQKVEAGEQNATFKTLARLADALGVRPEELLV
jgi:transcriptional regulator with XRE-family HTH domain